MAPPDEIARPKPLNVNPPPPLKYGEDKVEEWTMFKQQYELFATISELGLREKEYQSAVFLHSIGNAGLKIYNNLVFANTEDKNDVKTIIKKIDGYIIGDTNETYERYKFNRRDQAEGETIDEYVAALRDLAKSCNFCSCPDLKESLLRDRIVLGIREDQVRKELLQKRKLSLDEAVDHCRSCEASSRAMRSITEKKETIHKVESRKQKKQRGKACYFCGGIHD